MYHHGTTFVLMSSSFKKTEKMEVIEAFAREGSSHHEEVEVSAVNNLLEKCPFTEIFGLVSNVKANSDEETHVLSSIARIFASPQGHQYLSTTEDYLVQALNSSTRKKIRGCIAQVFSKMSHRVLGAKAILSSDKLRLCLLEAIANESDIGVYEHSATTLVSSLKQLTTASTSTKRTNEASGDNVAISTSGRSLLLETSGKIKEHHNNSVVLMRYVELIVQLSIASTEFFQFSVESNLLDVIHDVIKQSGSLNHPYIQNSCESINFIFFFLSFALV
jgi:hypothetical protein